MVSVYDQLEMNLNLLLLKNYLIMQKNGISVFVLMIELDGVGCCHLVQSKKPPQTCVMSVTLLGLGIFHSLGSSCSF